MELRRTIFRTNDIRGHAERDLTDGVTESIGRAYGSMLRQHGVHQAIVARDNRVSSDRLRVALLKGLTAAGIDVTDIGLTPTPVFYFARYHLGIPHGIIITGSHNPPDENGFKLIHNNAPMIGAEIRALAERIETQDYFSGEGRVSSCDITPAYIQAIRKLTVLARPLKVVVDSGNGMAGGVAPEIFRQIGAEVIELYSESDGTFPNHFPDPTLPETLQELISTVRVSNADLGIAFDGDADRVGVVDNTGRILWGDMLLALFFREVAEKNQGRPVVVEVKCSQATYEDIEQHGGAPLYWKTGHALIEAKMHETHAAMAGEMSGHLYFGDEYHPYDDGIYGAARMLRLVAAQDLPLSALADDLPRYEATPEFRVGCSDEAKFAILDSVVAELSATYPDSLTLDGIRVQFPDGGWALVRCSQTSPRIIVRAEGKTVAQRDAHLGVIRAALAKHPDVDLTALDQYLRGEQVTSH